MRTKNELSRSRFSEVTARTRQTDIQTDATKLITTAEFAGGNEIACDSIYYWTVLRNRCKNCCFITTCKAHRWVTQYKKQQKLENVTINDVLPLKGARRDAIANLKCFWGLGHQRPNFDGYIHIQYAAPSYSARISAMYFLPFGNVWLGSVSACNAWEAQCRIYEWWVRTLILF